MDATIGVMFHAAAVPLFFALTTNPATQAPPSAATQAFADGLLGHLDDAWAKVPKSARRALKKVKEPQAVALWVGIDDRGMVKSSTTSLSSGDDPLDDLAHQLLREADPFPLSPKPPEFPNGLGYCLVALGLERKKMSAAVACFDPQSPLPALGQARLPTPSEGAGQAISSLFAAWQKHGSQGLQGALDDYHKALQGAPNWDQAIRAVGLAYASTGKMEDGMVLITAYLSQNLPSEEVDRLRHEQQRFARYLAEKRKPRKRLSKADIAEGLSENHKSLEPCLDKARHDLKLKPEKDTLLLAFKIKKSGEVYNASVLGPQNVRMTGYSECIEAKMETWRFAPFTEGSEVAIKGLPLPVVGTRAEDFARAKAAQTPKPMTAEEAKAFAAPTMAQCTRKPAEVNAFLKTRIQRLHRCFKMEKKRNRTQKFPPSLKISLAVEPNGEVVNIAIDHRHFREGPLLSCVQKELAGSLDKTGGTRCPTAFNLDLRKL